MTHTYLQHTYETYVTNSIRQKTRQISGLEHAVFHFNTTSRRVDNLHKRCNADCNLHFFARFIKRPVARRVNDRVENAR